MPLTSITMPVVARTGFVLARTGFVLARTGFWTEGPVDFVGAFDETCWHILAKARASSMATWAL